MKKIVEFGRRKESWGWFHFVSVKFSKLSVSQKNYFATDVKYVKKIYAPNCHTLSFYVIEFCDKSKKLLSEHQAFTSHNLLYYLIITYYYLILRLRGS
jgi:hypothetical protein